MALAQYNPDTRPLPPGWSQHLNERENVWVYVQDNVVPKRTFYVHPSSIRPEDLNSLNDGSVSVRTPAFASRNKSFRRARSTTQAEPSLAQQLYASSIKKPPSPVPSAQSSSDTSPSENRNVAPYGLESDGHHRIVLDSPAAPSTVSSSQRNYPRQLVAYLSTSTTPANDSDSNERSPTSSHVERSPVAAPIIPSTTTPVSPKPIRSAPLSPSEATLFYNSAIIPHNRKSYPRGPRTRPHSSRPSISLESIDDAQRRRTMQVTSETASVHPQHTTPLNRTPLRTMSHQPVSTAKFVDVRSRSTTLRARAVAASTPIHSSAPSSTQIQVVTPPTTGHRRPSAPAATHTKAFVPPLSSSILKAPAPYNLSPTQYLVSGPPEVLVTTVSSWPPPTTYILPLSSHKSSPATKRSSHSTSQSVPAAPFVSQTSIRPTSSQFPTLPQLPLPPASRITQATAPIRANVVNQPASNSNSMPRRNDIMLGLAAGAAGVAGGVILDNFLGNDDSDVSGLINGMGNLMGGNSDIGGGVVNAIFDGNATDTNAGGGGNGIQALFDQGSGPYVDPSYQGNIPYFDPYNQGNGIGPSVFDQPNQPNPYDQQQGQQQQNGPNFMDAALQAYAVYQSQQQQQQQQQNFMPAGGASAAVGPTYQNYHGQMPSGAPHPQHHTASVPTSYHTTQNTNNNLSPHGQTSQTSQAGQPKPPLFGQDGIIKPAHVKQFAKGALIAGRIAAKFSGVN